MQNELNHGQKICRLYKNILKLHKGLPSEVRLVGDLYMKDEFRRHKSANEAQTYVFIREWTVRL